MRKAGHRLRLVRTLWKLSQADFGAPAGANQPKMHRMESSGKVSQTDAMAFQGAYHLRKEWILWGERPVFSHRPRMLRGLPKKELLKIALRGQGLRDRDLIDMARRLGITGATLRVIDDNPRIKRRFWQLMQEDERDLENQVREIREKKRKKRSPTEGV